MNKRFDILFIFSYFVLISMLFSMLGIFLPDNRSDIPLASVSMKDPVIVIDAGHGGEDGGACTYGDIAEKELNLLIANDLSNILTFCGINVVLTRTEDTLLYDKDSDYHGKKKSQDLAKRLEIANKTENSILVSIHMNAFPEEKYKGLQIYFSPHTESSYTLANSIQSNVRIKLAPDNNRKVKKADNKIYLLDRFNGTGILIECGFLSNPEEYNLLCTAEYRKKLSGVIAESIINYIKDGGR